MSLLDDWKKYVEEPTSFDKHHFESLMLELETTKDIHDAFDSLPSGQAFADRLIDVRTKADFSGTYLVPHVGAITAATYQLAESYRDGIFDFLKERNDLEASTIAANPIVEIDKSNYRTGKKMGSLNLLNVTWTIDDIYIDYIFEHPSWMRGLREAVYMMTTVPEVTRYLLSPIINFPLDDGPAAELWLSGHRMDFCKDRTLLIVGGT